MLNLSGPSADGAPTWRVNWIRLSAIALACSPWMIVLIAELTLRMR